MASSAGPSDQISSAESELDDFQPASKLFKKTWYSKSTSAKPTNSGTVRKPRLILPARLPVRTNPVKNHSMGIQRERGAQCSRPSNVQTTESRGVQTPRQRAVQTNSSNAGKGTILISKSKESLATMASKDPPVEKTSLEDFMAAVSGQRSTQVQLPESCSRKVLESTARRMENGLQQTVVYWCVSEHRLYDNRAFFLAQQKAIQLGARLMVIKFFVDDGLVVSSRLFEFLVGGLKLMEQDARSHNIHFQVWVNDPAAHLPWVVSENNVSYIYVDHSPLREHKQMLSEAVASLTSSDVEIFEVESRYIIPLWLVASKSCRMKELQPLWKDYEAAYNHASPGVTYHEYNDRDSVVDERVPWERIGSIEKSLKLQKVGSCVDVDGRGMWDPAKGYEALYIYIFAQRDNRMWSREKVADTRSYLSPFLAAGLIGSGRCLQIAKSYLGENHKRFLTLKRNIFIKRETAANFVHFTALYDSWEGIDPLVMGNLQTHFRDPRPLLSSDEYIERGVSKMPEFNWAQNQLRREGIILYPMRRLWGSALMSLTESPEKAFSLAVCLNKKYGMDCLDAAFYYGLAVAQHGRDLPLELLEEDRSIYGMIRPAKIDDILSHKIARALYRQFYGL